jgi:hypothetical protein
MPNPFGYGRPGASPVAVRMDEGTPRGHLRLPAGAAEIHRCSAQSYQNASRETFWYDWGQKPYKASYIWRACGEYDPRKIGILGGWMARSRDRSIRVEYLRTESNRCAEFVLG